MKILFIFAIYLTILQMRVEGQTKIAEPVAQHSYQPEQGFVPDQATAVAIAEAIWLPIYGRETLNRERPFNAILNGDVWTVTGTAHWENKQDKGGVAVAEISRIDARIIRVSHGM